MRTSSLIIAILGLGFAGGSAFVAKDLLEQQSATQTSEEAVFVTVIVARQDIGLGQPIESQMLTTLDWPAQAVPKGVFTQTSDLLAIVGGEPRRARSVIREGELVLEGRVSDFGEKVTIVQSLAEGHRAMAIEVDEETAVGGFVTPGDFVDVLLTHGRGETLRAVTILQNVRVIGVDQDADQRSDAPEVARTVTVEVSPEEGQRLALAQQAGTLSLSLRTEGTELDAPLQAVRLSDLLQNEQPILEGVTRTTIKVRRGTEVSEVTN